MTKLFGPDMTLEAATIRLRDLIRPISGAAALEARMLVCAAADHDLKHFVLGSDCTLGQQAVARLEDWARRRLDREPVSRIIGRRGFWSLDLEISPAVLDPRPDTETLIEVALDCLKSRRAEVLRILDWGVGSGAILATLLVELPNAVGVGVDISPAACGVARCTLTKYGLAERASIVEGGWETAPAGPYDLIVSNPPYLESSAIEGLDPEVRRFDPTLALDGGPDGLTAYRAIAALAPGILADGGEFLLEIGTRQACAVSNILHLNGFGSIAVRRDLGGNDRVVTARMGTATE